MSRSLAPAFARAPELPPPRAYGLARADLGLDFGRPDRPELVTATLALCCREDAGDGSSSRTEAAWRLPVGARILRLLEIAALTEQREALDLTVRCPQPECGQASEVALALADLRAHGAVDPAKIIPFPPGNLQLRLPNGRDQAHWRERRCASSGEAVELVVRTLAEVDGPIPREWIAPLAEAMREADPLVDFQVEIVCPHCGHESAIPADLEAVALGSLAKRRRRLLRDVHALAGRYGWTEDEVLAIPAERRAEYRAMIDEESGSLP